MFSKPHIFITTGVLFLTLFVVKAIAPPVSAADIKNVQGLIERSEKQGRQMTVPTVHNSEAEKAARETARIYHSREYQARLKKETERLKTILSPYTAQKNASTAKTGENAFLLSDERIYLFISSSMPVSTLRNYAADIDKLKDPNITMVMKGFVNGMKYIKPTIRFVSKILVKDPTCDVFTTKCDLYHANQHGWPNRSVATPGDEDRGCNFSDSRGCIFTVNIEVDPLLFSRYKIAAVPAILYARGVTSLDQEQSEGLKGNTSVSDTYLVSGDVSLEYALEKIRKESGSSELQMIVKELRRGFY